MKSTIKIKLTNLILILSLVIFSSFLYACNPIKEVIADPLPSKEPQDSIPKEGFNDTNTGFGWDGATNADGNVLVPTLEPLINSEVNSAGETDFEYISEIFQLTFRYPSDWALDEYTLEPVVVEVPASHVIVLESDPYKLLIHLKFQDDHSVLGGGLGAGEVFQESGVSVLGETINRNKLVFKEKTKLVWYSLQYDGLEIFIRLENIEQSNYEDINIPDTIIVDIEEILGTFANIYSSNTEDSISTTDIFTIEESSDGKAVEGWVGVMISTPDLPQIDDYFQMLNQDGDRYGILSLDPELQERLVNYRDSGVMIKVWGTLYLTRMDAYNTQIEVTQIEEVGDSQVETSAVEDWVGILVSNPADAQFDDYFQLKDQEENRYGIDSLEEEIREKLITLRDTGNTFHVWGTLYKNVPDAYGFQIQVIKVEVEE